MKDRSFVRHVSDAPSGISLSRRLSFLFAILTAAVLAALTLFIDHRITFALEQDDYAEALERVEAMERLMKPASLAHLLATAPAQLHDLRAGRPRMHLWILEGNTPVVATQPSEPPTGEGRLEFSTLTGEDLCFVIARSVITLADGHRVELVAATDQDLPHDFRVQLYRDLALAFSLAVVIVALVAWLVPRWAMRPLRNVAAAASKIQPTDLAMRLPQAGLPEEVAPLVTAFNGALDRVEGGYKRLEQFSADIAHELRTPLQNMIGAAQVTLSRDRSTAECVETIQSLLEEAERLRRMTAEMLFLASLEAAEAPRRIQRQTLMAADEIRAVTEFFEAAAEDGAVTTELHGNATLTAEPVLFRRAMTNLVSNAVRHAASGSTVRVEVAAVPCGVRVLVRNDGPTIDAQVLTHLFDRFQRGSLSRTGDGHVGLGLAIVKAIMDVHGGNVSARSEGGRTEFALVFPLPECKSSDVLPSHRVT